MAAAKDKPSAAAREPSSDKKGNGAAPVPSLGKDQELFAFREMLMIRRFEEKAGQMYGMGLIGGFCHLYIGQEAIVVGMQRRARRRSGHHRISRSWAHAGMRDGSEGRDGELTGRARLFQGKGGSMHMFSAEKDFMAATASSAPWFPRHRLGVLQQVSRHDNVTITYFDGATNQVRSMNPSTMASCGSCRWSM